VQNTTLYFSLGSNLGNRWHHLERAVCALESLITITQISPVYETIPWGPVEDQPLFLNACLEAITTEQPEIVLPAVKRLERTLGRDQSQKWGPHEIDIDLLFYGDLVVQIGDRTIPHRQIRKRPFVLCPLADIAPDFIHPEHQKSIMALLAEADTSGIKRLPGALTARKRRNLMATSSEYLDYIVDLMTIHYPITTRKMFGGIGIFCDHGMFALITSEDVLHFKVDDANHAEYEAAEMPQFMKMPYFQVPSEVLDSQEQFGEWLTKSIAVSKRSPKKKK
jgi:2-amino-4-hydroxy-6-hydroxymethyldihydropteridine diphosphokinase